MINILKDDPRGFYWFIYEYFLKKIPHRSKTKDFVLRFGYGSRMFKETMSLLRSLGIEYLIPRLLAQSSVDDPKYYIYITDKEYKDVKLL